MLARTSRRFSNCGGRAICSRRSPSASVCTATASAAFSAIWPGNWHLPIPSAQRKPSRKAMTADAIHSLPLTPQIADSLAAKFAGDMAERWRRGERPTTEEYLARCPELAEHPHAAADLIYEEFCLHREHGQHRPVADWFESLSAMAIATRSDVRLPAVARSASRAAAIPVHRRIISKISTLMAELGRGVQGPVFLARQRSLDRSGGAQADRVRCDGASVAGAAATHAHRSALFRTRFPGPRVSCSLHAVFRRRHVGGALCSLAADPALAPHGE